MTHPQTSSGSFIGAHSEGFPPDLGTTHSPPCRACHTSPTGTSQALDLSRVLNNSSVKKVAFNFSPLNGIQKLIHFESFSKTLCTRAVGIFPPGLRQHPQPQGDRSESLPVGHTEAPAKTRQQPSPVSLGVKAPGLSDGGGSH